MKKMIGFISVLAAILVYVFIQNDTNNAATTNEGSAESLPVVGILQFTSHPSLDDISQGTIDALAEAGFVDGETITLDFQNAQGDQSNLSSMSARFVSEDAKLMVGIATPAAQALANNSDETPIVMGAISDPVGAGLVESLESPGGNVTGVRNTTPVKEQFELIHQIMPEAETVGIIYSSSEDNAIYQVEQAKVIAEELGYEIVEHTVSNTNEVAQMAASLASQVDAIYVPNDNIIASAMNTLIEVTDENEVPVFPSVDVMVEQGGIATVGLNQYELGRLTGEMAASILNGEGDPSTMPVQELEELELILNEEKAAELGITIPDEVLEQANKAE